MAQYPFFRFVFIFRFHLAEFSVKKTTTHTHLLQMAELPASSLKEVDEGTHTELQHMFQRITETERPAFQEPANRKAALIFVFVWVP